MQVPHTLEEPRVKRNNVACVPCQARKVRRDASDVGIPCTRCREHLRSAYCTPNLRRPRSQRDDHAPNTAGPSTSTAEPQLTNELGHGDQPSPTVSPVDMDAWQRTPDDEHVQTLRGMAGQALSALRNKTPAVNHNDRHGIINGSPHVIEHFDRSNATAGPTEALGFRKHTRLIRTDLAAAGDPDQPYPCYDSTDLPSDDMQYLRSKHVFDLPPPEICRPLLRAFFDYIWPYTPVFDRTRFCSDFRAGTVSYFLLYAVLANAVPYVDFQVLQLLGYPSRDLAQKEYVNRATLLHYFGLERRQLQLLQGFIVLSTIHASFAPNADHRSWFQNAVRIATQIGLHRQNRGEDLEPSTHQLGRRIWWVLVQRDVLFSVSGLLNARCLDDQESDVAPLTELDWPEESLDHIDTEFLSPLPITAKQFFIYNGGLAQLGALIVRYTRSRNPPSPVDFARQLDTELTTFRQRLPPEFHVSSVTSSSTHNLWVVLLGALSQRLECVFFRIVLERVQLTSDEESIRWCKQRLFCCIFELDAVVKRAFVYDLVRIAPSSLIVCACNLLAYQIEIGLDHTRSLRQRHTAKAHIYIMLGFFRDLSPQWRLARWTLRASEWVVQRAGLALMETPSEASTSSAVPPNVLGGDRPGTAGPGAMGNTSRKRQFTAEPDTVPGAEFLSSLSGDDVPDPWILDFLGENIFGQLEDHLCAAAHRAGASS